MRRQVRLTLRAGDEVVVAVGGRECRLGTLGVRQILGRQFAALTVTTGLPVSSPCGLSRRPPAGHDDTPEAKGKT